VVVGVGEGDMMNSENKTGNARLGFIC